MATAAAVSDSPPLGPILTVFQTGMDTLDIHSGGILMIGKLASGEYRLHSRKKNPKTGRRRNLGTFTTRAAAEKHERAVQFFKRH